MIPPTASPLATLYKLTVSLAIFFSLLLIAYIWHLGGNSMIACGFLGAFFIHLGARPNLRHIGLLLAAGALVALIYAIVGGPFGAQTFARVMGAGAFLGVGSLLVMSIHKVWTGSDAYKSALRDAFILPVFSLVAALSMQLTSGAPSTSFDFLLYRFESSMGIAPGPAVVSLFRELPWIKTGASLVYAGLLIFPPLYHAWACYQGKARKIHLMHAFVIAGVCGFVLYQICPAIGPLYAFGQQFPDRMPAIDAVPATTFLSDSVHNAMPSMHFTWALLVWVAAWELGSFAVVAASVFVTFTGLATVGFGEHYLIDLVVSIPIVMLVQGICRSRHGLTATGLAMVIAWTVYLRTGVQLPAPINWFLVLATVVIAGILMRSLVNLPPIPFAPARPRPVPLTMG